MVRFTFLAAIPTENATGAHARVDRRTEKLTILARGLVIDSQSKGTLVVSPCAILSSSVGKRSKRMRPPGFKT